MHVVNQHKGKETRSVTKEQGRPPVCHLTSYHQEASHHNELNQTIQQLTDLLGFADYVSVKCIDHHFPQFFLSCIHYLDKSHLRRTTGGLISLHVLIKAEQSRSLQRLTAAHCTV